MGKTSNAVKARYNAKTYDQIMIKPRKDTAATIRAAAEAAGESLQGWIIKACMERIERDLTTGTAQAAPARADADSSGTD